MAILKGPLADPEYKGRFSGHETFAVRHGWLKKVADAVSGQSDINPEEIFNYDIAIAHFGVGKNMVAAMRHWALTTKIIEQTNHTYQLTPFGELIFSDEGLDPYSENKSTLWLLHWRIASSSDRATTWYWAFNHYALGYLEKEVLIREILLFCDGMENHRVSLATIKNDVDCFFNTYLASQERKSMLSEDSLVCPLTELGLIVPTAVRGRYEFRRGQQPSLPDWVLLFAIAEFWPADSATETISLESLSFDPGSPGQVFKLDEQSLGERLLHIEQHSDRAYRWSDTAGMNQLIRTGKPVEPNKILRKQSGIRIGKAAA